MSDTNFVHGHKGGPTAQRDESGHKFGQSAVV